MSAELGKYKTYPEYKNLGSEWLDCIPSQWSMQAIKYLASCNDDVLSESTNPDYEFEYIDIGSVSSSEGVLRTETLKFSSSPSRARRIVRNGDIIISTVRTYLEAIAPIDSKYEGSIVSTGFAVIRPKWLCTEFAKYALRARYFIDSVVAHSTGISYPAINASELVNICIAVPSVSEQYTIAAFLDYETSRIDRLIAKQQQLIELLKEKRQAVISHVVTKGLNPDVPMKDSGVEWLGQVPEHWVVSRYKFCTTKVIVGIAEAATHAYTECGVPIVRSTNITEEGIRLDDVLYLTDEFALKNISKRIYKNDVITIRTGNPGISAVVPEELHNSQCFTNLVATPKKTCRSDFLSEYLNSHTGKSYFELLGWGSAQKNISVPILQNIPIAYPSKDEQQEIMLYVTQQRAFFSQLMKKSTLMINSLFERRSALISAAVTGKIDLRNWAPPVTPSDEVA